MSIGLWMRGGSVGRGRDRRSRGGAMSCEERDPGGRGGASRLPQRGSGTNQQDQPVAGRCRIANSQASGAGHMRHRLGRGSCWSRGCGGGSAGRRASSPRFRRRDHHRDTVEDHPGERPVGVAVAGSGPLHRRRLQSVARVEAAAPPRSPGAGTPPAIRRGAGLPPSRAGAVAGVLGHHRCGGPAAFVPGRAPGCFRAGGPRIHQPGSGQMARALVRVSRVVEHQGPECDVVTQAASRPPTAPSHLSRPPPVPSPGMNR